MVSYAIGTAAGYTLTQHSLPTDIGTECGLFLVIFSFVFYISMYLNDTDGKVPNLVQLFHG